MKERTVCSQKYVTLILVKKITIPCYTVENLKRNGVKDDSTAKRSVLFLPDGNHESNPCSDETTGQQSCSTTLTPLDKPEEVCSFGTVPVWLKANGRKLNVNALFLMMQVVCRI